MEEKSRIVIPLGLDRFKLISPSTGRLESEHTEQLLDPFDSRLLAPLHFLLVRRTLQFRNGIVSWRVVQGVLEVHRAKKRFAFSVLCKNSSDRQLA